MKRRTLLLSPSAWHVVAGLGIGQMLKLDEGQLVAYGDCWRLT